MESTPLQQDSQQQEGEALSAEHSSSKESTRSTKFHLALVPVLMKDPMLDTIPPVIFLKAAGDGLFITLLVSWIFTLIFHPEVIADNPLKERLGYNNLCIGWDVPPENYVAAVLWIVVAYLAIRFCHMNYIHFRLDGHCHFLVTLRTRHSL